MGEVAARSALEAPGRSEISYTDPLGRNKPPRAPERMGPRRPKPGQIRGPRLSAERTNPAAAGHSGQEEKWQSGPSGQL